MTIMVWARPALIDAADGATWERWRTGADAGYRSLDEAIWSLKPLPSDRNHIERFFDRLKINCAIATRYDPLAESFPSMVHIAVATIRAQFCLSRINTANRLSALWCSSTFAFT